MNLYFQDNTLVDSPYFDINPHLHFKIFFRIECTVIDKADFGILVNVDVKYYPHQNLYLNQQNFI